MQQKWLKAVITMLAGAILYVPATFALGLGEIEIHSKLNQTLDAEIEITSATSDELRALRVSVPENEIFERYGLELNRFVSNLQFAVEDRGNGKQVIRVLSSQPITEPFLTFLIQADWQQGRLLREYTVLIDPPLYVPGQSGSASTYVDPAVNNNYNYNQGTIERSTGDSVVIRPDYQSSDTYQIPDSDGGTRMVQRGDTLWEIAFAVRPDSSVNIQQTMLALYRANPEAFNGNINRLKAGQSLRIPTRSEIGQIGRSTAASEYRTQMNAWRSGSGDLPVRSASQGTSSEDTSGTLELRVPDIDEVKGSLGTGGTEGTDGLSEADKIRMSELEEKVNELTRMLSIKDDELAALRDQSASTDTETTTEVVDGEVVDTTDGTETTDVDPLDASVDTETTDGELVDGELTGIETTDGEITDGEIDGEVTDGTETVVDTTEVEDTTDTTVDTTEDTQVTAVETVEPEEEGMSWLTKLLYGAFGLLGLLALGGLSFLGYNKFLKKGPSRDTLFVDDELDSAVADIANSVKDDVGARYDDTETRLERKVPDLGIEVGEADASEFENEIKAVSRYATVETPRLKAPEGVDVGDDLPNDATETLPQLDQLDVDIDAGSSGADYEATQTIDSDAALPFEDTTLADATNLSGSIELDQNNPIAEADFHMAYGLYDQATDLVKGAIEVDGDNFAYKEKLLEVYFVSGNKDEFVKYAKSIKDEVQANHSAAWDNVVIMGKQLAPEEAMFAGALNAGDSDGDLDFAFSAAETGSLEVDQSLFDGLQADVGADGPVEAGTDALDMDFGDAGDTPEVNEDDDSIDFNFDLDAELAQTTATETVDEEEFAGTAELEALDVNTNTAELEVAIGDDAVDVGADLDANDLGMDLDLGLDLGTDEAFTATDGDVSDSLDTKDLDVGAINETAEMPTDNLGLDLEIANTGEVTSQKEAIDALLNTEGDGFGSQTMEFKPEGLDFDIDSTHGASTALNQEIEKELDSVADTVMVDMDDAIDFDMGDLGLTNTTKAADIIAADQSEETLDFAFDLDDSLDVEMSGADLATDNLTSAADGLNAGVRDLVEDANGVSDTAEIDMEDNLDLLLSEDAKTESEDDLDFDFGDALAGEENDPFPDATLPGMVENDLDKFEDIVVNPDDTHTSTAQISDDELAAMGLSDDGPQIGGDMMDATGFGFDEADLDLGDEVSTKLDLANAYIEMDDAENAKSILKEVIEEGNAEQAQNAKDILSTLS